MQPFAYQQKIRLFISAALAAVVVFSACPAAAGDDDHRNAMRLRRSGEILPLQEVLKRSKRRGGERVLDVELERKRDGYIYEVESLDKKGRVRKDYYDAKTGNRVRSRRRRK